MKILISGFEPFGGEKINPAYEAVKSLPDMIDGHEIIKCLVPTAFSNSFDVLKVYIEKERPDFVISVGQAGGRKGISLERVALNMMAASIPDNLGYLANDEIIEKDGPKAYFVDLCYEKMLEELKKRDIPVSLSYHAGTFVCNYLMYKTRFYIEENGLNIGSSFIHVPYIYEQVIDKTDMSYLKLEMIVEGLTLCLKALIKEKRK